MNGSSNKPTKNRAKQSKKTKTLLGKTEPRTLFSSSSATNTTTTFISMSSSDLFLFDDSFFRHFPDAFSSDTDLQFLSDPLYHFPDPSQETPQSISNNAIPSHLLDSSPIPPSISYSPPNKKIQTLSLGSPTSAAAVPATAQGVADLGVKLEEFCMDIELENDQNSIPISLGMMQRSFSSQSLDRNPAFPFQPHFSSLLESPNFQTQIPNSAENKKIEGAMRRACSTGDLQQMPDTQSNYATSYTEEAGSLRVGRYSAEERKHRILRYRTKRNQRNFNKTIKYACRKTLADSRPRVRGRFARNDEAGESIKAPGIHREEEDEEELWVDGLHEEEEEVMAMTALAEGNSAKFQRWGC